MTLFAHTHCVAFELSNTCPYAWLHKECPLNLEVASPFRLRETKHLSGDVVRKVLDTLGEHGYVSTISFHQYNESLVDPRLFEFVRYARKRCPEARIIILTNGVFLSRQLALELEEAGLSGLWVTLYGSQEDRKITWEWMKREIIPIFSESNVQTWGLDDRLCIYDREYQKDQGGNCYAPLSAIIVTRDAEWGLCCMDWKRTVSFGSLKEHSLEELLQAEEPHRIYAALSEGDRTVLDLCRRCTFAITPR